MSDTDTVIRLADIRAIPDMTIGANGTARAPEDSWRRIDLLDDAYRTPPEPPVVHGLLYLAKRHVISGPPESAKTLIAYTLLLEAQRAGHGIAIIDFEMGPHAAATMLRELGATDEEIGLLLYFEPQEEPYDDLPQHLAVHSVQFVLIDASAGAYDVAGLDDNHRKDVEKFAGRWIRPLWNHGIATIVIDHVTKNADTRGGFAIGSERKGGQADIHLGLDALKTLSRGHSGLVKITAHKDRPGWLERPTTAMVQLTSDPDTHQIDVTIQPAEPVTEGPVRHTIYAEKISRALEANDGEPMSQSQLEELKLGAREYVRQGAQELVSAGYAKVETGLRGAKLFTIITPFRHAEYDPAVTPPSPRRGEVTHPADDPAGISTEIHGAGSAAGDDPAEPPDPAGTRIDVYDENIQHLLDDDPDF